MEARQARQDKQDEENRCMQEFVEEEVALRMEQALACRRLDDVTWASDGQASLSATSEPETLGWVE